MKELDALEHVLISRTNWQPWVLLVILCIGVAIGAVAA